VVRRHGRGQAWLLGTYPGFGGTAYRDPDSAACTLDILRRCGITSDAAGGLLRRRRRAGSSEAWILTNASPDVVAERLDVSGWGQVTDLLGESLQREGDLIGLEVAALDVRVLVLER
jgi:hypothetical protein